MKRALLQILLALYFVPSQAQKVSDNDDMHYGMVKWGESFSFLFNSTSFINYDFLNDKMTNDKMTNSVSYNDCSQFAQSDPVCASSSASV